MPGPRVKNRYGARALYCAGPKLWNSVPPHIQDAHSLHTFKTMLKIHVLKPPHAIQLVYVYAAI